MFKNIVPIVHDKHKNLKVRSIDNFDFVKDTNIASVMVHEFSRVSSTYPIVFLEDPEQEQFRPVVLLGLEEGENLFVEGDNWKASYIPAIIRRYPFVLAGSEDGNRFTICIDDESEFVNEEEGQALFNEKGEASEAMERVKRYLAELQQMDKFTSEFVSYLSQKNMFTPLNMKVKVGDEIKSISGAYVVNEERLTALSDETFLDMRKKQYLPVIYSHLSSLSQIERLLTFKDKNLGLTEKIEDRFLEN